MVGHADFNEQEVQLAVDQQQQQISDSYSQQPQQQMEQPANSYPNEEIRVESAPEPIDTFKFVSGDSGELEESDPSAWYNQF